MAQVVEQVEGRSVLVAGGRLQLGIHGSVVDTLVEQATPLAEDVAGVELTCTYVDPASTKQPWSRW